METTNQLDDAQFGWVPFYEEVADKLLNYKERRDELLACVKDLTKDKNVYKTLDDIDPFTVIGIFNRKINDEYRKIIARKLADFLGVRNHLPENSFSGIPILVKRFWFFDYEDKRDDGDINSLWHFFELALAYADDSNAATKQKFCESYNKVIKQRQVGYSSITMGLFWIRPQYYPTLDRSSQKYITREFRIKFLSGNKSLKSENYLEITDQLNNYFQKRDSPVHSFPELSLMAYETTKTKDNKTDKPINTPTPTVSDEKAEYETVADTPPPEPYSLDNIKKDCFIAPDELEKILARWQDKQNIILQGPPGTGKTWLAKKLAYALIGQKATEQLKVIQFHPNYSYEDFVIGYRPQPDGNLKLQDGTFLEIINEALAHRDTRYVVVIEEINRGNPAQIFGELLTLLEADKRTRDEAMTLSYGSDKVFVPKNLYVIGTMNIADRSLALVDYALRRRFAFIDLKPEFGKQWEDWVHRKSGIPKDFLSNIRDRINTLNDQIAKEDSLGPQFKIGHSFFTPDHPIKDPEAWYEGIVDTEIYPLLKEYWFDNLKNAKDAREELIKGL